LVSLNFFCLTGKPEGLVRALIFLLAGRIPVEILVMLTFILGYTLLIISICVYLGAAKKNPLNPLLTNQLNQP
jgi:hypothetical protein